MGRRPRRRPIAGSKKTADKTLSAAFDPTLFDYLNGNTNKALKSVNSGLNSPASQKHLNPVGLHTMFCLIELCRAGYNTKFSK